MSLNSFSTFKHTLTQADSLTLCTMYHTSLIQAAVVLLKDWNCCLVTSQIWTRSCFFFSIQKKQHNPNFMSEFPFFYLCFRCASLPVCISSVSYLVFVLSFFFIAPQMELSFYLEITKTTFKPFRTSATKRCILEKLCKNESTSIRGRIDKMLKVALK